jgi:DNA-directed RNA polymerase specialized sigma24 family protein
MVSFPTTQWCSVAEAGNPDSPAGVAARADLCRRYWYPIYSFIRSRGHSPDEAGDLTQDYFCRLLEGELLAAADQSKGRFRSLLRVDCGYFLADCYDHRRAIKRGGDRRQLSLDIHDAERRYCLEPTDRLCADRLFDRNWALKLLDRALAFVASEEAASGRASTFETLKPVLTELPRSMPSGTLAEKIGTTATAVRSAVQRLRRRYREALRAEVAATLIDPTESDVDDEIRALFAVFAQ